MVFDYGMPPSEVELMTVSRLTQYLGLANDLRAERAKQSGFK
jgi:hypothetical protein